MAALLFKWNLAIVARLCLASVVEKYGVDVW